MTTVQELFFLNASRGTTDPLKRTESDCSLSFNRHRRSNHFMNRKSDELSVIQRIIKSEICNTHKLCKSRGPAGYCVINQKTRNVTGRGFLLSCELKG